MSQPLRIHICSLCIFACVFISLKLFSFLSVPLYTILHQYLLPYEQIKNTFSVMCVHMGGGSLRTAERY